MSKVEQLEGEVRGLNSDELQAFRKWFAEFDAERWDHQIETDSRNGKLAALADQALADHSSGRSTVL